jgi:hypothetical protein
MLDLLQMRIQLQGHSVFFMVE